MAVRRPAPRVADLPLAPPTGLAPPAGPADPSNLVIYRDTALPPSATGGQTSVVDETTVSSNGNVVFYTGNFYDAISLDGGATFSYLNPATTLPNSYGGFCCDQVTSYDPSRDLTFWALAYYPDAQGNDAIRLAMARGQNGVATNTWTYWDITPQSAGFGPGLAVDYPQLALSSNYLYLSANVLEKSQKTTSAVIYRFALDDLAGGVVAPDYFTLPNTINFTPATGATTTLYWATQLDNATLLVYSWPEAVDASGIVGISVAHAAYPVGAPTCPGPDGTDMCREDNSIVRGGWIGGGVLGFLWDAPQGTGDLGTFPFPYVDVARIDPETMTLIDEPIIWNSQFAWGIGIVAANARGGVAATLAYAGGPYDPGSAVLVLDDLSPSAWQSLIVQSGTAGPVDGEWGDWLGIRPASGNGSTWVATAYTLQGPCSPGFGPCGSVEPRFLWFGRERDNPLATADDVTWSAPRTTPALMAAGATFQVSLSFTNVGTATWPAGGTNPVQLGYRWLDQNGNIVVPDGTRTALPSDVGPGGTASLIATVRAPSSPGSYTLVWRLVQQGVAWFDQQGAPDLAFGVTVWRPNHFLFVPLVGSN